MATITTARYLADLPAPQPPRYNLLASALVVGDQDPHWAQGVAARAYPLGRTAVGWSYEVGTTVVPKPGIEKDRSLTAKGFSVVYSYGCTRAGFDTEEARLRAQQVFAAVEPKIVEAQLWTNPLGVAAPALDADNDPGAGNSLTTLNSGTAVKPILGFALLEQFAAESSLPGMIHARPGVVSLLGGMYETAGPNTIQTKLGTPIVSGAGYPGTGPSDGAITALNEWAFVSGPVVIYRNTVDVLESFDHAQNDYALIVEREYLVVFDWALQAAVKIDKALA